jgi:hypothetical protein
VNDEPLAVGRVTFSKEAGLFVVPVEELPVVKELV